MDLNIYYFRAGSLWSHARFSSSKNGGEKEGISAVEMDSSQVENTNDKSGAKKEDATVKDKRKAEESGQEKSRVASLKLNDLLNSMLKVCFQIVLFLSMLRYISTYHMCICIPVLQCIVHT